MKRKRILLLLLSLLIMRPLTALALPAEVEEALPAEAQDILDAVEVSEEGIPSLAEGLGRLWNQVCSQFGNVLRQNVSGAVMLLGVVLLCSLAEDCSTAAGGSRALPVVPAAGCAAVTMIAAGNLQSMMGLGIEVIDELGLFSKALLPTLMAAVAASGGAVSAGVRHVAAVFVTDVLLTLIRDLLLPLVYVYVTACAADALVPGRRLGIIGKAVSKGITWLLSGAMVLYTGYLTLAGVAASSADALTLQVTRTAMGALPVVGGIISDAAGTVLTGASVLKSTIGVAGTLAVLAMCLLPFLHLAVQYLLYKVTAFLAGTLGAGKLVELIDSLGGAFGLILGMAGASATLLLISMITSVMVVTG